MSNKQDELINVLEFTSNDLYNLITCIGNIVEPKVVYTGDVKQMQEYVINESKSNAAHCLVQIRDRLVVTNSNVAYINRVLKDYK